MGGSIPETGRSTRCMDQVYLLGPTVEDTKVSIMTTRNREEECSHGLTVGSTTDYGRTVSKRELAFTSTKRVRKSMADGPKERESTGLTRRSTKMKWHSSQAIPDD